jgi:hypothetical protein
MQMGSRWSGVDLVLPCLQGRPSNPPGVRASKVMELEWRALEWEPGPAAGAAAGLLGSCTQNPEP